MESSTHYIWSSPGAPIKSKLAYDVVDHILQDVLRGFSAIPKRGAEVGGILLGQFADTDTVVIDGFQAVPCDYKLGPGYEFGEDDRKRFAAAVSEANAGERKAVGYYRSNTGEDFSPNGEDLLRMNELFPDARSPLLLIRPYATKVTRAKFVFRKDCAFDDIETADFPLSRKLLGGGSRRKRLEGGSDPEATVVGTEIVTPEELVPPPAPGRSSGTRARWAAGLSLAVALGWAAGYLTEKNLPPPPQPEIFRLGLEAHPRGNDIEVRWNARGAAIRTASGGSIRVKNDAGEKSVRLDLEQLRQGRAIILEASASPVLVDLEINQIAGSAIHESTSTTRP